MEESVHPVEDKLVLPGQELGHKSRADIDWYDVRDDIQDPRVNLLIAVGGRGIGKTYSALEWLKGFENMLYIRNQEDEIKLCCTHKGNPFKRLNRDKGYKYTFLKKQGLYNIIDEAELTEDGLPRDRGTAVAMTVSGKVKGFDFSDSDAFVYDEFIPKKGTVIRGNLGDNFMEFYETAARNREILGEGALKGVLLSNATTIESPILEALNVQDCVERMLKEGLKKMTIPQRKIKIVLPDCPKLKAMKAETTIYQAAGRDSRFARYALDNEFTSMSLQNVVKRKVSEYIAVCAYEDLYIYRHKSRAEYYVCTSHADVERYTENDTKALFTRRWWIYKDLFLDGTFKYSSYTVKRKFLTIFNL